MDICPICKNSESIELYTKNNYNVIKCIHCSYVYINPRPDLDFLSTFYNDCYTGKCYDIDTYNTYYTLIYSYIERAKHDIEFIKKYKKTGTLLDIGCGLGHFLSVAKDNGFICTGTEISNESIKYAEQKYNLNIKEGDITNINFNEDKFDIITIFDVLEHVINPDTIIKKIYNIVNSDGYVFISVPNVDCLQSKLKGKNWTQMIPPNHLNFFNTKTLTKLLENNGFKIIDIKSLPSLTIGLRKTLNNIPILNQLNKYITIFKRKLFYPIINWIVYKYNIESNLLVCVCQIKQQKEN